MERRNYNDGETIVLFVALPDCASCFERIETLMKNMNCWEKVEIGYPSDHGMKVWLYCRKEDKETDYWEKAKEAKRILEIYHYRVM